MALYVCQFKTAALLDAEAPRPRYVTIYEIECDDPYLAMQNLIDGAKNMVISPSLDPAKASVRILEPGSSRPVR